MPENPSFTIFIPVYERLFGFEEALQSARAVSGCTEILVADNCSSHTEFETICAAQNDPRIRYVRHPKNLGIYGSINRGAQLATGEFFANLDSDDLIAPDIYERFLRAYREMPQVDVFFGPFNMFFLTEEGKRLNKNNPKIERVYPTGPISSQKLLEDAADLSIRFPVLWIVRRECILQYPYIEQPHGANDWFWIYSRASKLNLYADEKVQSYWRIHGDQDTENIQDVKYHAWPSIYCRIAEQLKELKSPKSWKAYRRGESMLLNLLVNEKKRDGYWRTALTGELSRNDLYLSEARKVAERNWVLRGLIHSKRAWPLFYNVARACRRMKLYQGIQD